LKSFDSENADFTETVQQQASDGAKLVIHTDSIEAARPYPSRDDEYGIPIEKKSSVTESLVSSLQFEKLTLINI